MSLFGASGIDKVANKLELLTTTTNNLQVALARHMEHEESLDRQKAAQQKEIIESIQALKDMFNNQRTENEKRYAEVTISAKADITACQNDMRAWIKDTFVTHEQAKLLKDETVTKAAIDRQNDLDNYALKNEMRICAQEIAEKVKEDRLNYSKVLKKEIREECLDEKDVDEIISKKVRVIQWLGGLIVIGVLLADNFKFVGAA